MDQVEYWLSLFNGFLWGKFLWVFILAAGLFLTVRLRFMPLRKIAYGFRMLWAGRSSAHQHGISPFSALMVSLSATIGIGNIAGVATAIGVGGPGALFWMWMSALLGMATKYAEAVCAVRFREVNRHGKFVGGPMYYIKNGMGKRWLPLAAAFALFGALAGFGIGNAVQAHSVADALHNAFGLDKTICAVVLSLLVAAVLLGGLKGIAHTARALVPFMSIAYLLAGLAIVISAIDRLPHALDLVFSGAFSGTAAEGGFVGALVALAIEKGVARGVFSNEAGLGSAPIAHAAAETNSPVEQGCIAMLGTFIDTLVICSITGLAIIVTGAWSGGGAGVTMSQAAFSSALPFGADFVAVAVALFAFTTILGWSYYGERCAEFLFGESAQVWYRVLWVAVVPLGVLGSLDLVWSIADLLNGLMAIPNVIALLVLSPLVVRLTKEHFANRP